MDTIITISGPARHGKTESAKILKRILENKNRRVMVLNFADYLKVIATNCYDYQGEAAKGDPVQRELLQRIGTEIGRKHNENFWRDIVASTILAFRDEFDIAIIADARYPNECNILKDDPTFLNSGGKKVVNLQVIRRNFDNGLSPENKGHSSENGLKFFDFDSYIDSESIKELEEKLVVFVEKHIVNKKSEKK